MGSANARLWVRGSSAGNTINVKCHRVRRAGFLVTLHPRNLRGKNRLSRYIHGICAVRTADPKSGGRYRRYIHTICAVRAADPKDGGPRYGRSPFRSSRQRTAGTSLVLEGRRCRC